MTESATIPRRIFQTARTRELGPLARAAATNLKLLHPDWEYRFFDDADIARFIATEFPQYGDVFASFPRAIQRIDFFRYLVVLRYGGFYFDLDVLLWESVETLRSNPCVFPFEELTLSRFLRTRCDIDWEIGNYAFGATAGHPFLQAIVDNCVRAQRDKAWISPMLIGVPAPFRADFDVLNTTGPGLITRTLAEDFRASRQVTILYAGDVCDKQNWHRFGRHGVHLMEATWRSRHGLLLRKLALLWEQWERRRLLPASRRIGPSRNLTLPHAA